jgi:hypothetical protein
MGSATRAEVAEWQTRRSQTPLGATPCGFESHLRYQLTDAGVGYPDEAMAPRTSTFIGYPTDHMLAAFPDPTSAAAAASAVAIAGIPSTAISVLRGAVGARRLDGTGASHGALARTRRLVSFTLMDQLPDMAWYERAVLDGGAVLMVRVRGDGPKAAVLEAMRANGGHFINYYGRFATEELARWRGPEPQLPSLLKR